MQSSDGLRSTSSIVNAPSTFESQAEYNPSGECKKFLDDLAKFGNESTQEEKISLFHSQDANGDGKVTFFEYVNAFISEVGCKASYEM